LPRDTFRRLKIYLNAAFAVGALPWTSLGELTALSIVPITGFGVVSQRGEKGSVERGIIKGETMTGRKGREGRKGTSLTAPLQKFLRGPMRSLTDNRTRTPTAQVYTGLV